MPNITFVDTPGKLYDLFFLFLLNFNKEQYLSDNPIRQVSPEEATHYTQFLDSYPAINEDLRVFFWLDDTGRSFLTHFYFEKCRSLMLFDEYDLSVIRKELSNVNQVKENMLLHYFPALTENEMVACKNSVSDVNLVIKSSNFSGDLKASLYNFFIDPNGVLQILRDELLEKSFIQELDCNRNLNTYQALRKNFDFSLIENMLSHNKRGDADFSNLSEVYVSFCTYCKDMIYFSSIGDNTLFLMLGSKYETIISSLQNQEMFPDLKAFGQAISDANRVAILDLIYKNGKVTAKEVEQDRGLSAPNTYYHLSLMVKAGVLNSSNVGKTVYYSINNLYFRNLSEIALYYSKGGKVSI